MVIGGEDDLIRRIWPEENKWREGEKSDWEQNEACRRSEDGSTNSMAWFWTGASTLGKTLVGVYLIGDNLKRLWEIWAFIPPYIYLSLRLSLSLSFPNWVVIFRLCAVVGGWACFMWFIHFFHSVLLTPLTTPFTKETDSSPILYIIMYVGG